MKKQLSFKKELVFKTKLCEITSISLEHHILKKEDGVISGEFIINGEYKMTEGSINREKYDFKLPFDIALNSKYDINSVKVDIDDFYYEIVNNERLNIRIELLLEAISKIEEEVIIDSDVEDLDTKKEDERILDTKEEEKIDLDSKRSINIDNTNVNTNDNVNTNVDNNLKSDDKNIDSNVKLDNSLFNMEEETYKAYYVYIVKEDDTMDSILDKYGISKEDFEMYNKVADVKVGNKVIIPYECK